MRKKMKMIMRGVALIILPFSASLPASVFMYWTGAVWGGRWCGCGGGDCGDCGEGWWWGLGVHVLDRCGVGWVGVGVLVVLQRLLKKPPILPPILLPHGWPDRKSW